MAQPTGQLALDTGGAFYGYFWYANDTTTAGLWDARTSALATKTGTGGVASEGGADVAVSSGTTYYTLPSPLTLSGNFTLGFRARLNAAGQAAMIMGDRSGLDHFVWLNNGSNELRLRALGNTLSVANGAATAMATYYITRASGVVTAYRDGASIGGMGTATENLVIRTLMDGYDSGTYAFAGAAEFFHIIPGVALSAGQVASLSADPYQVLVSAADTTPPTLSSATAAGGLGVCSGSVSTNEANGTLYVVATASATAPTPLQAEAGQDHTGAAALRVVSQAVTATGTQTVASGAVSGGAGTRYLHFMHKDAAGNRSAVATSASFAVTAAATTLTIALKLSNGSAAANLTGIEFVVLNAPTLAAATAITTKGSGESSDASGNLVLDISGMGVATGNVRYVVTGNSPGTVGTDFDGWQGPALAA